ncbi:MAG: hypothetical protein RR851_10210 [Clostridium sp.]
MYKEYFGIFKQLEFLWDSDEEMESSKRILDKIYTNNPNFWKKKDCWLNYNGEDKEVMIKAIISKDIYIYEYNHTEPDDPKSEYEKQIYETISSHSKSSNNNIQWIYWRAYNFLKEKDLYFTLDSVYMNLTYKDISTSYRDERINLNDNNIKNLKIIPVLEKKSLIRCGSFNADNLICNAYETDYIWVFPNLEIPYSKSDYTSYRYKGVAGTEIPCYLIEITDKFKEKLEKIII